MNFQLKARPLALTLALFGGGFALTATSVAPVMAADAPAKLKVGDVAPDLSIATWWKNKNLAEYDQNRVYLVYFWASSSAPSCQAFPGLTGLKKSYGSDGLEIVAVSLDEKSDDAATFLQAQGGTFDFFVGVDKGGVSWNNYGRGAGKSAIPMAFLVDTQGKIAWMGQLMDGKLEPAILRETGKIPLDALPVIPKSAPTPPKAPSMTPKD